MLCSYIALPDPPHLSDANKFLCGITSKPIVSTTKFLREMLEISAISMQALCVPLCTHHGLHFFYHTYTDAEKWGYIHMYISTCVVRRCSLLTNTISILAARCLTCMISPNQPYKSQLNYHGCCAVVRWKKECVVLRAITAQAPRFFDWCLTDNEWIFLPVLPSYTNAKYACVVKTVDWVKN